MVSPNFRFQTETKRRWFSRNYDRAAWFYEKSAQLYSGNQIADSKKHQLNHILPGAQVIYLGVGAGEDAVMAAEQGVDVTCVDISKGMLARLDRKLKTRNLSANLICQNALEFEANEQFDVCCANYFLNMFKESDMRLMLGHATKFIRPGGKMMIADVAVDRGGLWCRAGSVAYRKFAMVCFNLLGLVELHRDYEYVNDLHDLGFDIEDVKYFRLFGGGPVVFQCIVASKSFD